MRRTQCTSIRSGAALLAILVAACGTRATPDRQPAVAHDGTADAAFEVEVTELLGVSADAWNRADLDGFISDYAADATFVGSDGLIHGADRIRRLYAEGYWATGEPADALRFEVLDARRTGLESGVAFGRYILYDRATEAATNTGVFTLVLRRIDGTWKIIHDHSSADTSQ